MDYAIVREPDRALLAEAVQLHYEALSYRSFITTFGEEFLLRLYTGLLRSTERAELLVEPAQFEQRQPMPINVVALAAHRDRFVE